MTGLPVRGGWLDWELLISIGDDDNGTRSPRIRRARGHPSGRVLAEILQKAPFRHATSPPRSFTVPVSLVAICFPNFTIVHRASFKTLFPRGGFGHARSGCP